MDKSWSFEFVEKQEPDFECEQNEIKSESQRVWDRFILWRFCAKDHESGKFDKNWAKHNEQTVLWKYPEKIRIKNTQKADHEVWTPGLKIKSEKNEREEWEVFDWLIGQSKN